MLSVTGSALVYRLELNRYFEAPAPRFDPDRPPLTAQSLTDAARRAYPGWQVVDVGTRVRRHRPLVGVRLTRGDEVLERAFDPYSGADLGDSMSWAMRALNWLSLLHDDLLLGDTGRTLNGYASGLVLLLVATGTIVWWPTWSSRRRRGASSPPPRRSLNVRLHRSIGIWGLVLMLIWAVSGVYLAFPEPFDALAYAVSGDDLTGIGYQVLTWLTYLHFGRFSAALQIVWVAVGLLPAVLVVTGVATWWARTVTRSPPRQSTTPPPRWLWGRQATWATAVLIGCGTWLTYDWANYREERFVERFLATVAAGRYRDAHAMWEGDDYTFDDFLAEWGPRGRHTARGPIEVIDSTTFGAVVTVYIRTTAPVPVALEVDKETMLLSYAPSNEYGPRPPAP